MEHIFEAFQKSFEKDEKAIFITNVKDERNIDGDLMLTEKRMIFYPAKPQTIQDVLFISIALIDKIVVTEKGVIVSSGEKSSTYEMEHIKQDFIEKIQKLNTNLIIE